MNNYEAIFKRKSVRKYKPEGLTANELDKVQQIADKALHLFPEIKTQVHLVKEGDKLVKIMRGLVGDFGKLKAPHYLVISSEEKPGHLENAGYILEAVVLELTTMGIATCWMGGHVKEELLRDLLRLPQSAKPLVMVAFGYSEAPEQMYRDSVSQFTRKPLEELVTGQLTGNWADILEAVRLAPSAANSQPWRFNLVDGQAHVYCNRLKNFLAKKFLGSVNYIDMGIGLYHLHIAAQKFGKKPEFVQTKAPEHAEMDYIISVKL